VNERRVDTAVGRMGSYQRIVDVKPVTQRQDATSFCAGNQMLSKIGREISLNSRWVFETDGSGSIDLVVWYRMSIAPIA
jgi:hypothetical protein